MTETSPLATIERFDSSAAALGHGQPVFGIELAVRGDDAACMAEGAGELMVRGHWVAVGSEQDDWLATGDFATLQADAWLDVSDRLSDSLLVGDAPLSSALVEHRARQVPGVADAALVICEPGSGRSVLAWVAAPDAEPSTVVAELQAALAQAFDGWCPTQCTVVDAFPYTASAKVQKHLLKAQIAPQNESDVAPTLPSRADA
jgi:fatty-acyl-CoA synthase